ncbi:MAG TPA: pseudouridine-5'-phosphate glycosidase, partial [Candidatus Cloacimonetes bacterium]|nr:pseudouridine-5'-phosphate glycosidase [Candidatus Cloacimonadota bacterium]HEX38209.1 pseudouridine-5'-phosphate glycosidase [Candidatus Cloacimonadota bacterium]
KELDGIVRENGAVPATIAILNGKMKVGLSDSDLEFLATSKDIKKASRRDIPYLISQKIHGATTVAATMIIAEMAGIKVFVTGGIGGVHRGASETFDISADLQELTKTNVAVICAGAKAILDIGLTLEYLETQGVPVIGFRTSDMPAFYTRTSGFPVDIRLDSAKDVAELIQTKWELGLQGGVVVANPIPPKFEMDKELIDHAIEEALIKAQNLNITGKKITPFLLNAIKDITKGKSLDSNIELVKNNAKIGSKIACELASLDDEK